MDNIELDKEISLTRQAIKELKDTGDINALELAEADLSYCISLLEK